MITYDQQTVKVIPLDDLNLEPSIVKIDVEGFDYQVHARIASRQSTSTARVFHIEYTPEMMGDFRIIL